MGNKRDIRGKIPYIKMTPQLRSYCYDYLRLICSKEKGITTSFEELKNLHGSTKPYHKDEILEVLQRNGYINLYSRMVSATNEGIAFSIKTAANK